MGGSAFPENGGDSRQLYHQSSSVLPSMSMLTMASSPPPKQQNLVARDLVSISPKMDKNVVQDEPEEEDSIKVDEDGKDTSIAQQGRACETLSHIIISQNLEIVSIITKKDDDGKISTAQEAAAAATVSSFLKFSIQNILQRAVSGAAPTTQSTPGAEDNTSPKRR